MRSLVPTISKEQIASAFSNRKLQLIILPTEKCNFRCTYCYEKFDIGRMSDKIVTGIKRLISNRAEDIDELSVGWFGGEPLLAFSVIDDISRHIANLVQQNGFRYSSGITTNGYLLNLDTFLRAHKLGITDYQITMDGYGPVHDSTRQLANGEGTFQKLISNLLEIKTSKVEMRITLRVHLDQKKLEGLPRLMNFLNANILDDSRFSVRFHRIENLGGSELSPDEFIDYPGFLAAIKPYEREDSGSQVGGCYICYAAKPNSFVIRADGRISKCTVKLYNEDNIIGRLDYDGRLHLDATRHSLWLKGWKGLDASALACPAFR